MPSIPGREGADLTVVISEFSTLRARFSEAHAPADFKSVEFLRGLLRGSIRPLRGSMRGSIRGMRGSMRGSAIIAYPRFGPLIERLVFIRYIADKQLWI